MKKSLQITFIVTLSLGLFFSCSQESSSLVSRSYHNLTAHYNAYFLAKEKILEIERDIEKMHVDDYNVIIDVQPEIDSNKTKGLQDKFDYCLEKASLPIQKHKNSNWVDDSYILLGKVRMYRGKYFLAIQTFRYVVQKSTDENAKQLALAHLIRCYQEENNRIDAEEAIKLLRNEKLVGETEKVYHLNRAHYYHKLLKYDSIPESLEIALTHVKQKDRRARIHFILGQTYQRFGDSELAFKHYTKATKRNPPYETEFFARLNRSREAPLDNPKLLKRSEKFYTYSLKEEKNKEYRGRIYYEKALFELKKQKIDSAISLLNISAKQNDKYSSQKGYTYERLGEVFFTHEPIQPQKESYKLAKIYYDTTVTVISKSVENYDEIIERHEILTNFSTQVSIIEEEDSLQRLAKLDSIELKKVIDQSIVLEIERQKKAIIKAKEESRRKKSSQTIDLFQGKSNFIFYNADALFLSKEKFIDFWGNRKLEDNWRRSNKDLIDSDNTESPDSTNEITVKKKEEEEIKITVDRNQFIKNIPSSPEALAASNKKIIQAYYKLGKIYDFELLDAKRASKTYQTLLEEYPRNKYEAEVLYSMYLICSKNDFCDQEKYASQLFAIYPNSIFSKLVKNPNYVLDYQDENKSAKNDYENAYNLYSSGEYYKADVAIDLITKKYGNSIISDKLSLLKALVLAKRNEIEEYKNSLISFQRDYKTSNLIPFVNGLIEQAEKYQEDKNEVFNVIDTVYNFNAGEKHFFVAIFPTNQTPYRQILADFYNYNYENSSPELKTNLFDFGNGLSILQVGPFGYRQIAEKYDSKLHEDESFFLNYNEIKKESFVITQSNLFILLESKDLEGYKTFYASRYQKIN